MKLKVTALCIGLLAALNTVHASLLIDVQTRQENPSVLKEGGLLDLDKSITNSGTEEVSLRVYSYLHYPDGKTYVDLAAEEWLVAPGERFVDPNNTFLVPATFPPGSYTYHYNLYNTATSQILSDKVTFEKKSQVVDVSLVGLSTACGTDKVGTLCWNFKNGDSFSPTPEPLNNISVISINNYGGCAIVEKTVRCWEVRTVDRKNVMNWKDPVEITFKKPTAIAVSDDNRSACVIDTGELVCWNLTSKGAWNYKGYMIAPPLYSELKNPRQLKVLEGAACILHDDGISCWGNPGTASVPGVAKDVPVFTNPSHLFLFQISKGKVGCGADAAGIKCWGVKATHPLPTLQPDTQIFNEFNIQSLSFLDSRGAHLVSFNLTTFGPWVMPDYQNPTRFDYKGGHACALDDSGIVCSNQSGPVFVPSRFRY